MKKILRLYILPLVGLVCLFLGLCGMVLPSLESLPTNLKQLNWRSETTEIDLMNFPYIPISFAVTYEGYWAVAYKENIHCHILLVSPGGITAQYTFEAEGSWAMDISGHELMVYLARANTYFVADLLSGKWVERSYASGETVCSSIGLAQRHTVQQGTYTMSAHKGWNSYRLELNGQTILQVSPLALLLAHLPYIVPVLIPFLLFYGLRKNLKYLNHSTDQSEKI